jgi:phosphonate transport system substrate-binding protein
MRRRTFLASSLALPLGAALPGRSRAAPADLRIGLTPVFLDDQAGFLRRWHDYLEARLGRPVEFTQRGSYRQIVELLLRDKIDAAWVCGYPYVRHRPRLRLLAVPLFGGRPWYRSYLLVPAVDRASASILDLRGRVFAFSDPDSNSGYLYPNYHLATLHERAETFFGKTFFTWSHRKVVEAVAAGVAQAGAVDGYVWETLARFHPGLTARTRVLARSPEFGFPPFVTRQDLAPEEGLALRRTLVGMAGDAAGTTLLGELNLTGFTAGDEHMFDGIAQMARDFDARRHAPAA